MMGFLRVIEQTERMRRALERTGRKPDIDPETGEPVEPEGEAPTDGGQPEGETPSDGGQPDDDQVDGEPTDDESDGNSETDTESESETDDQT